jgi:hypothetical protein
MGDHYQPELIRDFQMAQRIIDTPQLTDPGTEGLIGYDYQRDLAVMLCIKMIENHQIANVVCEFHEDIVQIKKSNKLELIQVKKRKAKVGHYIILSYPKRGKNLEC